MRAAYNAANHHKQIRDEQPLPPKVREEYAAKYGALVDEGIQHLQKAIELRNDYEDAMAYLNLLYRRNADQVPTQAERETLVKKPDGPVEKVKELTPRQVDTAP